MAQIEIKKSSIDEKEAVKKETVKEISNLKKEVEKKGKVNVLPDREVGKKREVNVLPDREVRKKKAANVLDQEVEKGPLTKKDAEAFVKRVKKGMIDTMGAAALEAAEHWVKTEKWLLIDPKELNSLDTIYWAIILSVRHNPNAYLEKDENGKVYMPKDKFVKLISSFRMSQEDHDVMMKVMQKYEIE